MEIVFSNKTNLFFAQAYGTESYGIQEYSCEQTDTACIAAAQAGAPNTGFMGLTPDAAIASGAGALLVTLALVGTIFVLVARRTRKKKAEGQDNGTA